jgi:hypothetical protein
MHEFRIECSLELPGAALWRMRGTRRFMHHLVAERALARMSASHTTKLREGGPDGPALWRRTFQYVPTTIEIPDIVKTVFSDDYLEIADECTWAEQERPREDCTRCCGSDDSSSSASPVSESSARAGVTNGNGASCSHHNKPGHFSQSFVITPGVLADYICTKGTLSVEPHPSGDPKRCIHVLSGNCNVSLPFVGYYVEEAIIANMQTFYKAYPAHMLTMRDVLVKDFSDEPCSPSEEVTAEQLTAAASLIATKEAAEDEASTDADEDNFDECQDTAEAGSTPKPGLQTGEETNSMHDANGHGQDVGDHSKMKSAHDSSSRANDVQFSHLDTLELHAGGIQKVALQQ